MQKIEGFEGTQESAAMENAGQGGLRQMEASYSPSGRETVSHTFQPGIIPASESTVSRLESGLARVWKRASTIAPDATRPHQFQYASCNGRSALTSAAAAAAEVARLGWRSA
ncbi:hypothetical protein P8C59_003855 [Phyllachora maydis]|uniref:Uncharacterized protein n=1 Tax=Phyllachora maydis TaxID=1825666 RepID=A0AAD9MCU1_9PEZI|nr:hypothetical protein P8C59_003855 [Phyllachora maydis]